MNTEKETEMNTEKETEINTDNGNSKKDLNLKPSYDFPRMLLEALYHAFTVHYQLAGDGAPKQTNDFVGHGCSCIAEGIGDQLDGFNMSRSTGESSLALLVCLADIVQYGLISDDRAVNKVINLLKDPEILAPFASGDKAALEGFKKEAIRDGELSVATLAVVIHDTYSPPVHRAPNGDLIDPVTAG